MYCIIILLLYTQSMISHRPYLSIVTVLSMGSVICFYFIVFCQGKSNTLSKKEIQSRRITRARRRKEEQAKKEAEAARRRVEARESAVLRNRRSLGEKRDGREDDIGGASVDDNESQSQSGSETEDSSSEHAHQD